MRSSGEWIASLVEVIITFLPSNLPMSIFLSQAMITASAAAISASVRTSLAPPEPSFSTLMSMPSSFALSSKASAAMKV